MKKTSIILATLLLSSHAYASDQLDEINFYPGSPAVPVANQNYVLEDISQRTASTDGTLLISDDGGEVNLSQAELNSIVEAAALAETYMNLASEALADLKSKLSKILNVFEPDQVNVFPADVEEVVPATVVEDDDVEFLDNWDRETEEGSNLLEVVVEQVTPPADEVASEDDNDPDLRNESAVSPIEDTLFVMDDLESWDSSTEEVTIFPPHAPMVTRIVIAEGQVKKKNDSESDDSFSSELEYHPY